MPDVEPGLGITGCTDLATGLLCGLQLSFMLIKNLANTDRCSLTLNNKDCMKQINLVNQKKKKKTKKKNLTHFPVSYLWI